MRVQVAGRHIDVGEALRSRIETELSSGVSKYFNRATDAIVTVGKNGGTGVEVDCTVNLPSGMSLQSKGHGGDAHAAFNEALTKLEKRVRRYKSRLRNHHQPERGPLPADRQLASVFGATPIWSAASRSLKFTRFCGGMI